MTSLQAFIDVQSQAIDESVLLIAQLQQQLNELQTQLRVQQQIGQAQKSAEKELDDWLKQGRKLMTDLCTVYPVEAITAIAEEVNGIAEEVTASYAEHQVSGRFLTSNDDAVDNTSPDNIDGEPVLTQLEVQSILKDETVSTINTVRDALSISARVRKLESIAKAIADTRITGPRLQLLIEFNRPESSRPRLISQVDVDVA